MAQMSESKFSWISAYEEIATMLLRSD